MFKKFWKNFGRNTLIADMRLIRPRFRYLYRADFETGLVGNCLGALRVAYYAGHFYPSAYETPKERAIRYTVS
jgi:hypothetical protein